MVFVQEASHSWCVSVCPVIYVFSEPINQNMTVQLVLAFNEFVNPWALAAIGWKYVRLRLD